MLKSTDYLPLRLGQRYSVTGWDLLLFLAGLKIAPHKTWMWQLSWEENMFQRDYVFPRDVRWPTGGWAWRNGWDLKTLNSAQWGQARVCCGGLRPSVEDAFHIQQVAPFLWGKQALMSLQLHYFWSFYEALLFSVLLDVSKRWWSCILTFLHLLL